MLRIACAIAPLNAAAIRPRTRGDLAEALAADVDGDCGAGPVQGVGQAALVAGEGVAGAGGQVGQGLGDADLAVAGGGVGGWCYEALRRLVLATRNAAMRAQGWMDGVWGFREN